MTGSPMLTDDVGLVSFHVDALELSCSIDQVPLLHGDFDELDLKLARLKAATRGTRPSRPVPSGWRWEQAADADEPVVVLPTSVRKGYRCALHCSDWLLLVAAPRSVLPRFAVQLRADYLLASGPLAGYEAVRAWVARHLIPLVDGVPAEAEPVWRIARLDLAADVAGVKLEAGDLNSFTTRARARGTFHVGDGWDWVDEP